MASDPASALGRRERQIMEIVYRRGRATASDVLAELTDSPSNSGVRGMLRYLEEKGHLRHEQDGPRYVYLATRPKDEVRATALSHLVRTFFDGSITTTVAALLESGSPSPEELERLTQLISEAAAKEQEN